ncbi:MAG: hypothetical protein J0H42_14470 [Rhizobiales bacterium]|nr:hypothetical protein [Hyphomicrobiales bacterium]
MAFALFNRRSFEGGADTALCRAAAMPPPLLLCPLQYARHMLAIELEGDAETPVDPPNHEATPLARNAVDGEIECEWQGLVALDDQPGTGARYVQDQTSHTGISK